MEETKELAAIAIWEEFAGIVRHTVERLSGEEDGKPKRFQASMLDKMGEFLDSFGNRNPFAHDKPAELVDQARGSVMWIIGGGIAAGCEFEKLHGRRDEPAASCH